MAAEPAVVPTLVTTPGGLDELVERLMAADRYALDTEFHREKTYWPHLALVQMAWNGGADGSGGVALIDPLAVDIAPLAKLLAGPGLMVAHAAEQDLEVLEQACGRVPTRLYDTQIAAGFAGHATSSLAVLSQVFLGREVPKGDRLTDWRRRPLTDSQLAYAAADVDHLLDLADAITVVIERDGRLLWAEEECEALLARPHGGIDPLHAWWKLRDARQLRGGSRGVAQEVAAWRERRARELDQPVRTVLPDLAVQSIAHRPPRSEAALAQVRGLDGRHLRPEIASAILAAVERGLDLGDGGVHLPPVDDVARDLRPAVALAMAWVAQRAKEERIDPAVLATRSDLAAFIRGGPESRLASGWRAGMIAGPVQALVEGRAALAFDRAGQVLLEARSGRPLDADE
jgi:ribonuclease D